MFEIRKRVEISAAHKLNLDYESKCTAIHGHNWIIDIYLRSESLNHNGMIMDFSEIKQKVIAPLDHQFLNEVLPFNPTAELLAKYVCDVLQPFCFRVDVQESENNTASYIK